MPDRPLKGIIVCDYGQHGAGSACGKVLADWGAEVIKVEPIWGDPSRSTGAMLGLRADEQENPHFELINSGKKSIAIDLKTEEGREIMDRLIAGSNIFFSNYRLRSLKKYGLDYETLSAKYPSLIWGHINGYGVAGPMAEEPGFDNVSYWAYGGLITNPADPSERPGRSPFAGGDVMTGYVLASALAACLYQQAVSGKGEAVYTSLYGTACWQNSCVIQRAAILGDRLTSGRPGALGPLDGFFRSKDGVWFTLGIMDYPKIGPRLAAVIGREDLAGIFSDRAKLMINRDANRALLEEFFLDHVWADLDRMFTGIDIVHSRVNQAGDVAGDAQARANGFVFDCAMRDGQTVPMVSTPVKFGEMGIIEASPAPLKGENTTEVLRMLSYDEDAIRGLFERKVVWETKYDA